MTSVDDGVPSCWAGEVSGRIGIGDGWGGRWTVFRGPEVLGARALSLKLLFRQSCLAKAIRICSLGC